ncbi:MAG: ATP-binding cassette domain-containing protein [Thermoplasmatota archaeon]
MAIIEMSKLRKTFGEVVALEGLTLDIPKSEIFALLGPNGAGKTTTIRLLTTIMEPTSGDARIGGFDIVRDASAVRRLVGYVPQVLSADGSLTGYENLLVFAKLFDIPRIERRQRIREALEFTGLGDAGDRLVKTYSGGMIRRLEIAQSTLHTPRVLFLDEPTTGLDPVARRVVWGHIRRLRDERGATILFTTHYMEEADQLADRIAVMHKGRVAALGSPAELKKSIGKPDSTLDDVFAYYTGSALDEGGDYDGTKRARRTSQRMG